MHRFRNLLLSGHLSIAGVSSHTAAATAALAVSRRTLIVQTLPEPVKIERLSDSDSGIVELKLDRPEAKNAIGKEMLKGLQWSLEAIDRDSSANVVIFSSAVPKVFCAGADLKERRLMSPNEVELFVNSLRSTFSSVEVCARLHAPISSYIVYADSFKKINKMTKQALSIPTIAVVEGAALGGGLELALSCDLRICGENATFGLPETGLAIIPGAGGTQRLPRIVGRSVAKELIFTGRRIDGTEAMSIGLVNHCVPAGEACLKALQIARNINEKGPLALRMAKRSINLGMEMDMPSALVAEEECYEQLLNTKDRLEGLAAFAEKRKPKYTGQ